MKNAQSLQARLLQGRGEFTLAEPPRFRYLCEPAQELLELYEARLQDVRANPTEIPVNRALLEIQDLYFDFFESVSKRHKGVGIAPKGSKHTCIFELYEAYFKELDALRRQVNPPLLREPPAPAPVEQTQEATPTGICLGKDYGRAW